jgi:hypothetical protein
LRLNYCSGLAWDSNSVPGRIHARLKESQNGFPAILKETAIGSQGEPKQAARVPKQIPTYSAQDAQARLRNAHPQLRLERRLLRSKDGNGFWWAHLSSETTVEVQSDEVTCKEPHVVNLSHYPTSVNLVIMDSNIFCSYSVIFPRPIKDNICCYIKFRNEVLYKSHMIIFWFEGDESESSSPN